MKKSFFIILMLCFSMLSVWADSDVILASGQEQPWEMRYQFFENWEEAVDPVDSNGNDWYSPAFDDSDWPVIKGPLSDDNWTKDYSCFYLRKTFVMDPLTDGTYVLSMGVDDYAKVYLNGTFIGEAGGQHDFYFPSSSLVVGENVLCMVIDDRGGMTRSLDYEIRYVGFEREGVIFRIIDSENKYVEVTRSNYSGDVVIPDQVEYDGETYQVRAIGEFAFAGSSIQSVTIPGSVKIIEGYAFHECRELSSINISEGVEEIRSFAFYGCSELESVSFPQTLTKLGEGVFRGNEKLKTVVIPKSVIDCSGVPIWGAPNLESIVVEEGNPVYDSRNNCNAIIETATNTLVNGCKATIIPDDIATIGVHAFVGHGELKDISIPNSVKTICHRSFWDTGITTLTLPKSVETIDHQAFFCQSLRELIVLREDPAVITTGDICGENVILRVPTGCREAYENAEFWQNFMAIVEDRDMIQHVGQSWEARYNSVENWEEAEDPIDANGNQWYSLDFDDAAWPILTGPMANAANNTIPDANYDWDGTSSAYYLRRVFNLEEVKEGYYQFCARHDDAVKVYMNGTYLYENQNSGSSYYVFSSDLLAAGENVLSIYVDNRGGGDCYLDYGLYYTGSRPARFVDEQGVHYKRKGTSYVISAQGNFGDVNASSLVIPNELFGYPVSEIEYTHDNDRLNEVVTSLSIPASLQVIPGHTRFYNLMNLKDIMVDENNPIYDSRNNCNAVVERNTNTLVLGAINTVIPESVTTIGEAAFRYRNIEKIIIPDNIVNIDLCAFYECDKLNSVILPEHLVSIGQNAFSYCDVLKSISIPQSVNSIGVEAFIGCDSLTSVRVGMVTPISIPANAFTNRRNVVLYVPVGSKAAYEAADYWKDFKEIIEVRETDQTGNTLSATIPSLLTGKESSMSINLKNEDDIIMTEFNLQLPDGISIADDEDGYPDVTINISRDNRHSIEVAKNSDGSYHFLCYSSRNNAFIGTEGELFNVKLTCDENMAAGSYQGVIKDILMSDADRNELTQSDVTFDITVMDVAPGDANGDGKLNGLDIVYLVDYIMGRPSDNFYVAAADLTGDSKVNGMDLVELVSLVMSQGTSNAPARRAMMASQRNSGLECSLQPVAAGENALTVASDQSFILAQCVVECVEGQSLVDVTTDMRHVATWKPLGDNRYAVLVYSTGNASFNDNDNLFGITLSGDGDLNVNNLLLVDTDRQEHWVGSVSGAVTDGIDIMREQNSSEVVYDLQGRKVKSMQKGVYIVNSKKVVKE